MARVTWIDGTANWNTATAWSTGTVPGAADDAVIPSGTVQLTTPIAVTAITLSAAAGTLQIADPGGTESVTADFGNSGTVNLDANSSGSTLSIGGTLANGSILNIGNGSLGAAARVNAAGLSNTGTISLTGSSQAAAILNIDAAAPASLTGSFILRDNALLEFASGGVTGIASGATLSLSGQARVALASDTGRNSALNRLQRNDGIFTIANGLAFDTIPDNFSGTFTNTGTLSLSGGSHGQVGGAVANFGTLGIDRASALALGIGNSYQQAGGTTIIDGALTATAAEVTGGLLLFNTALAASTGVGTVTVRAGSSGAMPVVEFAGAVDSSVKVGFNGFGTVRIDAPGQFNAKITAFFQDGQVVDLPNLSDAGNHAATSFDRTTNRLTITGDSDSVTLQLDQETNYTGAVWVASRDANGGTQVSAQDPHIFLVYAAPGDLDGDRQADLVFTTGGPEGGSAVVWQKSGNAFLQTMVADANMGTSSGWSEFGTGNFDNDGKADLLWSNSRTGQLAIWQMDGPTLRGFGIPSGQMGTEWHVAGIGDFNGDRNTDIFWVSNAGDPTVWSMNGAALGEVKQPSGHMGSEWHVAAAGDATGDGTADLLWVSSGGGVALWRMSEAQLVGFNGDLGHMGSEWHVAAAGDVNGDGTADIVWVDNNNDVQVWQMSGGQIAEFISPSGHDGTEWHLKGVADFTGDGRADLVWLTDTGAAQIWALNGSQVAVSEPTTPGHVLVSGL